MLENAVKTVAELTREIKDLVEANFPYVWVRGEISNLSRAGSGHVYLTLKDESAQIRAVIWRRTTSRLKFELHDGLEVIAAGPVELYPARGSYQLIIEELIPQGIGALELAFRQLQEKLAAEGLFDPSRKRPLPVFPRRIALVTSPTGAAVRDMLQVIMRRWQAADVVIVPVPVQGDGAAALIAQGIQLAARIPNVDVVITGRGGGSLEDLWSFNEEVVARAIHASPIPVVCAVGHEIDVSIADLVADRRALTPSEAAELVVPDSAEIRGWLVGSQQRMTNALRELAHRARLTLSGIRSRGAFARPKDRIHELADRIDETELRLRRAMSLGLTRSQQRVQGFADSLHALSPLNVLRRGYSITQSSPDGGVVRRGTDVRVGDVLNTILQDGRVTSRVEHIENGSQP